VLAHGGRCGISWARHLPPRTGKEFFVMGTPDPRLVAVVRDAARPLPPAGDDAEFDDLLAAIGDARFVLLGEASHGTHEFYAARARITRRLIVERGFDAVAIEGDWPDAYRVNRHVRGRGDDADAQGALRGFRRFPTWMWRNTAVVDFVEWMRRWNEGRPPDRRAGFYGLDLYSLATSMEAVLGYLDRADPAAAARVRARYGCFEPFGGDSQTYGLMTGLGSTPSCEREVLATLLELQRKRAEIAHGGAAGEDPEAIFDAEQNAALVKNAERYYRTMFLGDVSSWNLRDSHMVETLWALERHLSRGRRSPRIVVWAHNSHLGDASATEMGRERGEHNVGQLVRERCGAQAFLVGFSTHTGTVTAASDWDRPAQRKHVRPSRDDSVEGVMHATGHQRFLLRLRDDAAAAQALRRPLLERAIGVIYRPETERQSHYFFVELPRQFDALLHFDTTSAVVPLERNVEWHPEAHEEVPETFPAGL
jgi:erythromycin esterase-like protein